MGVVHDAAVNNATSSPLFSIDAYNLEQRNARASRNVTQAKARILQNPDCGTWKRQARQRPEIRCHRLTAEPLVLRLNCREWLRVSGSELFLKQTFSTSAV